jgi:hypothetical protein
VLPHFSGKGSPYKKNLKKDVLIEENRPVVGAEHHPKAGKKKI